jgi:putative transposase
VRWWEHNPSCAYDFRSLKEKTGRKAGAGHAQAHFTGEPTHVRDPTGPDGVREGRRDPWAGCRTLQAGEITGAARHERSGGRKAYRAGHYGRDLTVKAGKLSVRVPKLKGALFESAAVERYRRREESVEEAPVDMHPAGVCTRRVDDIPQALWGERMPSRTLSDQPGKVCKGIDAWRERPLRRPYPYVFMDGVWHKRSWGGAVESVSVLVAIGVRLDGHREVIGVAEGMKEDAASWNSFVSSLPGRGLTGVRLAAGGRCAGLVNTVGGLLPQARHQRRMVHFMRGRARQGQPQTHPVGRRRAQGRVRHGITRLGIGQGRAGRG